MVLKYLSGYIARTTLPISKNGLKYVQNTVVSCPFGKTRKRIGPNLKARIFQECNGDKEKISKFARMFDNVFNDFNENTVFELGKKNEFLLYNRLNPTLTNEAGNFGMNEKNISARVLGFCTGALHASEKWLLKKVISA